jgi:hypothetical protein
MIHIRTIVVFFLSYCDSESRPKPWPGKLGGRMPVYRGKSVKGMEVEQRYVTKCFTGEGVPAAESISRLRDHDGEDALSRTQIYFWINQIKRGRIDLNNIASPGREPDECLAGVIAAKRDANPHLSERQLAQSLRIAASTVCQYLAEVMGMKCRHLRWVPHTLTAAQKVVRVELAECMLQALTTHERSHFHFLFTGDES